MGYAISERHPLLLGSQSPRRRDILTDLGIPLEVRPAEVNEDVIAGESIEQYLERVVQAKLMAVAPLVPEVRASAALAADTVVVVDQQILGKPRDVPDAVSLLQKIAGRQHRVLTRFAILCADELSRSATAVTVESLVTMRGASLEELERYAATGEGLDKAGAYAVQGCGAFLVARIDGSPSNVIGLPACEVVVELAKLGLLPTFPMVGA